MLVTFKKKAIENFFLFAFLYLSTITKVLPCLQELTEETPKPEFIVESFDTWFQEDESIISRLFKKETDLSLAELWTGMLKFYTESFQFDKNLIQEIVFFSFFCD